MRPKYDTREIACSPYLKADRTYAASASLFFSLFRRYLTSRFRGARARVRKGGKGGAEGE